MWRKSNKSFRYEAMNKIIKVIYEQKYGFFFYMKTTRY